MGGEGGIGVNNNNGEPSATTVDSFAAVACVLTNIGIEIKGMDVQSSSAPPLLRGVDAAAAVADITPFP